MRTLTIINVVLLVLVAAGFCLMAVKAADVESRLVKIELETGKMSRLSDDISKAWTKIGRIEAKTNSLTEQVQTISSKGTSDGDVEYLVRKVLQQESEKWMGQMRQRRAQGAKAMADLELEPEQVDAVGEFGKQGFKDWIELQKRVQDGEITQEEARRLTGEGWKDFQDKMKGILDEEQVKKLEMLFRDRVGK